MTKNGVFALKGASQRRVFFTKEKSAIYNKIKLGFCVSRLALVCSITLSVLKRTQFFNISTAQCISDGARVRAGADVVMHSIVASWARA